MTHFLKWLLITSFFVVLYGVFESQFQYFSGLAEYGPYHICHILWGLAGFIVVISVFRTKDLGILSFLATMTGLLGTCLGLSDGFEVISPESLDPANQEAVRSTMSVMFHSVYLAMNTTITGILVAAPTLVYMYVLGEKTNDVS